MQSTKQGKNEPQKAWLVHFEFSQPCTANHASDFLKNLVFASFEKGHARNQANEHVRDEADKSQLELTELLLLGSFCKNHRSFMLLAAVRFPSQADLVFHHRQRK